MDTNTSTSSARTFTAAPKLGDSLGVLDWIALILMVIGAINWGLVGALNFDLVAFLFGPMSTVSRVVYCLVGLAGLYGISMPFRLRPRL